MVVGVLAFDEKQKVKLKAFVFLIIVLFDLQDSL